MADGSDVPALRRSKLGEAFRASVLLIKQGGTAQSYPLHRARTFPWYLALLRIELEGSLSPLRPCSQVQVDESTIRLAREVIGIVRELYSDHDIIPHADVAVGLLSQALRSRGRYEAVAYSMIANVAEHLKNAEDAVTIKGGRRVHKLPRRSPRHRSLFPDPERPAWAAVNRMPPRKIQMPCRVEPDIKKRIEDEADNAGVSQSRWLEEAIAEKLQRHGHPVYLTNPAKVPDERPTPPRRTRRAALPEPEKSPDASANRADKVTTVRISKQLADRMDKQRGRRDRSALMNEAVRTFMSASAKLPEPVSASEALPVAVSLRFERAFFPEIEAAARAFGLTKSEWLRRVVHWYLSDK